MDDRQESSGRRGPRPAPRELAEVFGEVLPETTADERDRDPSDLDSPDCWYLHNRPPHHG